MTRIGRFNGRGLRPLCLGAGILSAVVAVAVATALSAADDPVPVEGDNAPRAVAARGRLEPRGGIIRVGAPSTPDAVSGAGLVKLLVDYGDDVKAGQVLAELDIGAVAAARLTESRAGLETARRDAVAAASLADEACVLADVAARQSRRKTELLGRGLASDEEAERAKGDAEAGAASCAARRAAARVAESAIASAQARVALYEAENARATIRAPFDGRVLDVIARPGEIVGIEGILELGRVGEMYAIAEVYEADVRYLRPGMRARVNSAALASDLTGTVERIRPKVQKLDEIGTDPAARKDARIIEVEVKLDDSAAAANLSNLQVDIEIGR